MCNINIDLLIQNKSWKKQKDINLNLMDLIQGEMTTVEISTSGSGNYAIVVS